MKLLRSFSLLTSLLVSTCIADDSFSFWNGTYKNFSSADETVGGSKIMLSLMLKVEKAGSKNSCELEMSGFQIYRTLLCSVVPSNNQLIVKFKSYQDGKLVNSNDVAEYKVGEVLFTIDKPQASDKSNHCPVQWGAYSPFGIKKTKAGEYFEKVTK